MWCQLLIPDPSTKSAKIMDETKNAGPKASNLDEVAPSDIISNLFLEDLEKIRELKKWIPDPCTPYLHYLKTYEQEDDLP